MRTRQRLVLIAVSLLAPFHAVSVIAAEEDPVGLNDPNDAKPDPATQAPIAASLAAANSFTGGFEHGFAFQVPAFFGIEPALALSYNSFGYRGGGIAGVGWGLSGAGAIRRVGPRKGPPSFTNRDRYLMGEAEVLRCETLVNAAESVSCRTGGNWAPKIESFQRVWQDPSTGTWIVTSADGTVRRFGGSALSRRGGGGGTDSWLLDRVMDVHRNAVEYRWITDRDQEEPRLSGVTYGPYDVDLEYESRPDPYPGTGRRADRVTKRLKSLRVRRGSDLVRRYVLCYRQEQTSGRSLLESIRQFGMDGVTNVLGADRPIASFDYEPAERDLWVDRQNSNLDFKGGGYAWRKGDFNGDGFTDLFHTASDGSSCRLMLGRKNGKLDKVWNGNDCPRWDKNLTENEQQHLYTVGDVNGDGIDDVIYAHRDNNHRYKVWLGKRNAETAGNALQKVSSSNTDVGKGGELSHRLGDFNCDGRVDVMWFAADGDAYRIYLGQVDGKFVKAHNGNGGPKWRKEIGRRQQQHFVGVGDFNGDGCDDVAYAPDNGEHDTVLYLMHPDLGMRAPTKVHSNHNFQGGSFAWRIGDFNGDGISDLFHAAKDGDRFRVLAGTPSGGLDKIYVGDNGPRWDDGAEGAHFYGVGDFNGDGIDDIAFSHYTGDRPFRVWLMRDDLSQQNPPRRNREDNVSHRGGAYAYRLGDFNGDGLTDIFHGNKDGSNWRIHFSDEGANFRVGANGSGGPKWDLTREEFNLFTTGDFNGDGVTDLVFKRYDNDNASNVKTYLPRKAQFAHVMTRSVSGLGGATEVTYRPSTHWERCVTGATGPTGKGCGVLPYVFPTVDSFTTTDGRGQSVPATFRYEAATYDFVDQRFLGFRYSLRRLPGIRDEESYYLQDYGSAGSPEYRFNRHPDGSLWTYTKTEYALNGADAPYRSLKTASWDYTCDGRSSCQGTGERFVYDRWGNVVTSHALGDVDLLADEKTYRYTFNVNVDAFLLRCKASEETFAGLVGVQDAALPLRQLLYDHDGGTNPSLPPSRCLPTRMREWDSTTGTYAETHRTFSSHGRELTVVDPVGAMSSTVWSADGLFVSSRTNPLGHATTYEEHPVCGETALERDPNGIAVHRDLDLGCWLRGKRTVDGQTGRTIATTTWEFRDLGIASSQRVLVTEQDGTIDGSWSEIWLDGNGRAYRTVKEGGRFSETVFGANGKVAKRSHPHAYGELPRWTAWEYDPIDRVRKLVHPDGSSVVVERAGRYALRIDEMGRQKGMRFDAFGQVTQVVEYLGDVALETTFRHDVLGRLSYVVDPAGNVGILDFDSRGSKIHHDDPDLGAWFWTYDPAGRNLTVTDARGQSKWFDYDALGRTVSESYGAAPSASVRYSYDVNADGSDTYALGRRTKVEDPAGTWETYYDARGNEVRQVWRDGSREVRADTRYDMLGRIAERTYPADPAGRRLVVRTGYDDAGRPASLEASSDSAGPWQRIVTGVVYEPDDQPVAIAFGNGTHRSFSYDPDRRWVTRAATTLDAGGALLQSFAYTRNARGFITSVRTPGIGNVDPDQWDYEYDALHRLVGARNVEDPAFDRDYQYDSLGNLTWDTVLGERIYPHAGTARPHAVIAAGANTYEYDENGNMIEGAGRSLEYDFENRPTAITSGLVTTRLEYNAAMRRVKKITPARTVVDLLGLGNEIVTASGTKHVHRLTLGASVVAEHVSTPSGEAYRWLYPDHLGGAHKVADATGRIVATQTYEPFGASTMSVGMEDRFHRFTDQAFDEETGLYDYKARLYDPVLGRFLTPDTIVPSAITSQDWNRYSYVRNNPVNMVDPSGHDPWYANNYVPGADPSSGSTPSASEGAANEAQYAADQSAVIASEEPAPAPAAEPAPAPAPEAEPVAEAPAEAPAAAPAESSGGELNAIETVVNFPLSGSGEKGAAYAAHLVEMVSGTDPSVSCNFLCQGTIYAGIGLNNVATIVDVISPTPDGIALTAVVDGTADVVGLGGEWSPDQYVNDMPHGDACEGTLCLD